MTRACNRIRPLLGELAAGVLEDPWRMRAEEHLQACADCRHQHGLAAAAVSALRGEPPALEADIRRAHIRAALDAGDDARGRTGAPRRWLWAGGLAAGVAAAAALVLVLWPRTGGPGMRGGEGPVLVAGQMVSGPRHYQPGDSLALGGSLQVAGSTPAQLRLADGSRVAAAPTSSLRLQTGTSGWTLALTRGRVRLHVTHQPPGQSVHVQTPEATVRVIGTRFEVERCTSRATAVSVREGVVGVHADRTGVESEAPRRRLTAHPARWHRGAWSALPGRGCHGCHELGDTPLCGPGRRRNASRRRICHHGREWGGRPRIRIRLAPASRAPSVAQIRRRVRAGQIAEARELIRRARRDAPRRRPYLAEIAIVEAEADLAESHYRRAIDAYLGVRQSFPDTPQAESALFAAAQLSMDHEGHARGAQLLRSYLTAYPQGRFRSDAQRLLEMLSRRTPP